MTGKSDRAPTIPSPLGHGRVEQWYGLRIKEDHKLMGGFLNTVSVLARVSMATEEDGMVAILSEFAHFPLKLLQDCTW